MFAMATYQCIKSRPENQQFQIQSSNIFSTSEISTEQQSTLFVKKLVAVGISSITYLRVIFPEEAYQDQVAEGLNLKMLMDDSGCRGAATLISWLKGCFDAIEKKFLKQMTLALCTDPNDPNNAIETYTFKFSYSDTGVTHLDSVETKQNNGTISSEQKYEVKKPTIKMLRTIIMLTETLRPLPDNILISMKLLYYDETPMEYEPPGFQPSNFDAYEFSEDSVTFKVGDVGTGFHRVTLRVKTSKKMLLGEDCISESVEKKMLCDEENPKKDEMENLDKIDMLNLTNNLGIDFSKEYPLVRSSKIKHRSQSFCATPGSQTNIRTPVMAKANSQCSLMDLIAPETHIKPVTEKNCTRVVPTTPATSDVQSEDKTPAVTPKLEDILSSHSGSVCSIRSVNISLDPTQKLENSEYPVRCPCRVNMDQGIMILCDVCGFWQHGACFTIIDEIHGPDRHYCNICADPPSRCTDPRICLANSDQVQATCLFRRALMILKGTHGTVTAANLAHSLGVDISLSSQIIDKMLSEYILHRRSRSSSIVNRNVLLKTAFPKYLNRVVCQSPLNEVPLSGMLAAHNDTIDSQMSLDVEGEGSFSESPLSRTRKSIAVPTKGERQSLNADVSLPENMEFSQQGKENENPAGSSNVSTPRQASKLSLGNLLKRKAMVELKRIDGEISSPSQERTPKMKKISQTTGFVE